MSQWAVNVLTVFHLAVALLLIVVVLIQNKKGDAMTGGLMGGSSQTIFGAEGSTNFLVKLTRVLAVTFMISCVGLAWIQTREANRSVVDGMLVPNPVAPAA